VLFHSDAAQAIGRIAVNVDDWGVDLLSLSAHKAYGPQGIGALYIRQSRHVSLTPLVFGGGHERGLRSGTLPVPQIVGMGAAFDLAARRLETDAVQIRAMRDRLQGRLSTAIPGAVFHGHKTRRLPGLLNVGFTDVEGDVLVQLLRGVAASQGSSCSTGNPEPSHVLRAINVSDRLARASLRLGVGRFNTDAEIELAAECIVSAVDHARMATSPMPVRQDREA
jgi:cysteine desulfurase